MRDSLGAGSRASLLTEKELLHLAEGCAMSIRKGEMEGDETEKGEASRPLGDLRTRVVDSVLRMVIP